MKNNIMLLAVISALLIPINSFCWNEEVTHNIITQSTVDRSTFNEQIRLLGFSGPKDNIQGEGKTLSIEKWFIEGTKLEDAGNAAQALIGYARYLNHFHNPLKDWSNAGLTDVSSGESLLLWAQDGTTQNSKLGGDWSWHKVRDYYYSALIATTDTNRQEYFARTFRGVGQQMHLIQDTSVPAHVRNDSHAQDAMGWKQPGNLSLRLETWAKGNTGKIQDSTNKFAASPGSYYPTVSLNIPISGKAPITQLVDADVYTGTNPTASLVQGLAEYTNANFASEYTIFAENKPTSDKQYFPYPQASSTDMQAIISQNKLPEDVLASDGIVDKTFYIAKTADGETYGHFARVGYFTDNLTNNLDLYKRTFYLDETCHSDYTDKLIPRAVGYSAALLDYFFRGKLTATYNVGDITFHTAKVTVTNATPGEAMANGDVSLVIRYKTLAETGSGPVKTLELPGNDYTYKVVTLANANLSQPQPLSFDLAAASLPHNFADMSMQVVYKGKLGNEDNSVAVSEWQPIDGIASDFALSLPPSGVYAKVAGESPSSTFNELRVNAMSDVAGGLSDGSISLELEYRTAIGDQFDSVALDTEPANGASYLYRTPVKNNITALPQNTPVELVFDLPQLPVQATDVVLNIVYTTANGNRYVGVRDISEPTPVDVYNNTDYSCIGNQWYVSGTPATRSAADLAGNRNGFDDDMDTWSHNLTNIYAKALSANSTDKASTTNFDFFDPGPLTPNTLKRLGYILTDYAFKYSFMKTWVHTSAPQDGWTINDVASLDTGTGFVNQADKGYGSMYAIRGNKMWWGAGKIFDNLKSITGSNCDWSQLPLP